MIIDVDTLAECWSILKQYVPSKDRQEAADNLVSYLIDQLDDVELDLLAGSDTQLRHAVKSYAGDDQENDDQENDDY